ncbi:unnamed protein product [Diamesa tonsa]
MISCVDKQIPGDKVIIKCKTGYKPINDVNESERICMKTGEWSGSALECEAECGYSSSGIAWNAPVFKNKLPICGGTAISEFIVLSAASCFVEQTSNGIKRLEITDYDVVVGKYQRDFDIRENAQFFKLRNIFIQDNYAGYEQQFDANYAVLTLDKPIIYTYSIFPICIDLNPITVEQKSLPAKDSQGTVAGFGYTEYYGSPAYHLQQIYLPLISDEHCKAKASKELLQFIRNDKFCAGYDTGSRGLCIGDDGGSIAFPRIVEEKELYFIYGIASNTSSLFTKGTCDADVYSLFTNVLHYAEEIRACLNINAEGAMEKQFPPDKKLGLLASFGLTEHGKPSKELRKIELPYIKYSDCKETAPSDYKPFLVGDKFCAGFTDGRGYLCQGDSGGGLVFIDDETQKYHLLGVASNTRYVDQDKSDPHFYSLFTIIYDYLDIIKKVHTKSRLTLRDMIEHSKTVVNTSLHYS